MGPYLSTPDKTKHSIDGSGAKVRGNNLWDCPNQSWAGDFRYQLAYLGFNTHLLI